MKAEIILTTVLGGLVGMPCVQAYAGWHEGPLPKVVSDSNSRKLLNDARRGDASAQRELGKMLIQGALIKRDIPNGVKWLKMSAEQGDAGAMLILGDLYKQGLGVPQDEEKAVEYYIEADERGNKNAAKRLRKLPLRDTLSWWEEKAEEGDKKAILKLMKAYAIGDGITKNTYKAKELYEQAYERWPKSADKALATLPVNVQRQLSNKVVSDKTSVATQPSHIIHPDDDAEEDDEDMIVSAEPTESKVSTATGAAEETTVDAPVWLAYSPGDMPSSCYEDGSADEVRAKYLDYLSQTLVCLMPISTDKRDIEAGCLSVAGYYALAELNRLTLQFKYGLSPHDIAEMDTRHRRDLYVGITKLKSLAGSVTDSESVELLKMTVAFMTIGHDGSTDKADKQAKVLTLCDFALCSALQRLENIRSAADEALVMKVVKDLACFAVIQSFVVAAMPDMELAVNNKTHSANLSAIRNELARIKNAGYHGSALMEEVLNDVAAALQL